jgi:hypothetical protein
MDRLIHKNEYYNWFGIGYSSSSDHLFSYLDTKRIRFRGLCLGFNQGARRTDFFLPSFSKYMLVDHCGFHVVP